MANERRIIVEIITKNISEDQNSKQENEGSPKQVKNKNLPKTTSDKAKALTFMAIERIAESTKTFVTNSFNR